MRGRPSPFVIELTDLERCKLEQIIHCTRASAGTVQRARIVLKFAAGNSVSAIARQFEIPRTSVRRWVKRFCKHRMDGLHDVSRAGRPPVFSPGGSDARRQDRVRAS